MSETVFTKVDYDLGSLVKYIALGEIGWLDPNVGWPVWTGVDVVDMVRMVDRVDGGRRSGEDEQTGRRRGDLACLS